MALIVVATLTLMSMSIFSARGLLLREDPLPTSGIAGAVSGNSDRGLPLALTLMSVLLAWLCALWLSYRFKTRTGQVGLILAFLVALQVFLLPIYHGVLFADRQVRLLSRLPDTVRGLATPVAGSNRRSRDVVRT